ncbi:MAG: hypothetical protein RL033_3358 [Pseudomonadota bacterium]
MGARCITCALLALALSGCGSDPQSMPGLHSVVLGTGEATFEHIAGEPELPLVAGSQGGFHVWASFLAYGFDSSSLDLTLTTTVDGADKDLVMHARLTTREILDADGVPARSFAGFPAQVRDARCANGQRVSLQLHVAAPGGDSFATDQRHCIVLLDPEFQIDGCP